MPIVRMPDNTNVRFPDDMPAEQIKSFISQKFPDSVPQEDKKEESFLDKTREFSGRFDRGFQGVLRNAIDSLSFGKLYKERPDLQEKSWNDIANSGFPRTLGIAGGLSGAVANMIPAVGAEKALLFGGSKVLPYLQKAPKLAESSIKLLSGVGATATDAGARALVEEDNENLADRVDDAIKFDLALRAGLGGLNKAFSAGALVKGIKKQGLSNVVGNDNAQKVLDRGVKAKEDIAREVKKQAPEALEAINNETINLLNNNLGEKVDVQKTMKDAQGFYDSEKLRNANNNAFKKAKVEEFIEDLEPKSGIIENKNLSDEEAVQLLKKKAKENGIEIYGDVNHLVGRERTGYVGSVGDTFNDPDLLYSQTRKGNLRDYRMRKYNNIQDGSQLYDLETLQDGKLYNKYPVDKSNFGNQFWDPKLDTSPLALGTQRSGSRGMTQLGATNPNNNILQQKIDFVNSENTIPRSITDGLTGFQQNSLNSALKNASSRTNSAFGSLDHVHNTRMQIDDMIETAKRNGTKSDIRQLTDLRDRVDKIVKNSLKEADARMSRAFKIEDAFNSGSSYNGKEIPELKTNAEKSAFAQGLVKKMENNVDTKNVSKNALSFTSALKKIFPQKNVSKTLENLRKNEERYGRIEQLERTAQRKTGMADPLPRPKSEVAESAGAVSGHLADIILNAVMANKYGRASQMLLGNIPLALPLYDRIEPFVAGIASYLPQYRNRKGE